MRLTYDLDSDRLIRGLNSPVELPFHRVEIKSSTDAALEWVFVRPFVGAEELAEPLALKFGVKEIGAHTDDFLVSNWDGAAYAYTLTGAGASAVYSMPVNWNTATLDALLATAAAAGREYVDLAGELKIIAAGAARATLNFGVRVFRAYVRGGESTADPNPEAGDFAALVDFQAHLADTANPHAVTKAQVGLGNADNTSDANKPISAATQAALDAKADDADLTAHLADTANPHAVTKAQVGLSNADNTSDADKPISTATQAALDAKASAAALTAHLADVANPHAVTKAQVGLGNADNTSDANKPVSTATQAALDLKADAAALAAHLADTANPHAVTKAQVGLGNADNTSDADKPISTATQAALDLKADAARTVSAAGLAAGGGDLSADRTITVPAASQAEAEAGADNTKAMTPLRVAQAISALGGGSGSPVTLGMAWVWPGGGNDTTGDGSAGAPWATAQKAYDEGHTHLRIGPGNAGTLLLDATGNAQILYIGGWGANNHYVSSAIENGIDVDVAVDARSQVTVELPDTNDHVHIFSDFGVLINLLGDTTGPGGIEMRVSHAILGSVALTGTQGAAGAAGGAGASGGTDEDGSAGGNGENSIADGGRGGILSTEFCYVIGPVSLTGGTGGDGGAGGTGGGGGPLDQLPGTNGGTGGTGGNGANGGNGGYLLSHHSIFRCVPNVSGGGAGAGGAAGDGGTPQGTGSSGAAGAAGGAGGTGTEGQVMSVLSQFEGLLGASPSTSQYLLSVLAGASVDGSLQIVGSARVSTTTHSTTSNNIPIDDTAPDVSEGAQLLSLAYTPARADTIILLLFLGNFSVATTAAKVTVSLFQGSTNIHAGGVAVAYTTGVMPCPLLHYEPTSNADARTYTVRYGANTGTASVNGLTSGRLYGGKASCELILLEIKA